MREELQQRTAKNTCARPLTVGTPPPNNVERGCHDTPPLSKPLSRAARGNWPDDRPATWLAAKVPTPAREGTMRLHPEQAAPGRPPACPVDPARPRRTRALCHRNGPRPVFT